MSILTKDQHDFAVGLNVVVEALRLYDKRSIPLDHFTAEALLSVAPGGAATGEAEGVRAAFKVLEEAGILPVTATEAS